MTINDAGGSTATAGSTATVADAALTAGTVTLSGGIEGVTPTTLSATFSDANAGAQASDFSGTINWGDGNTTVFTSSAISGTNGSFAVSGSHQYSQTGNYSTTFTINDAGGSTTTVTGTTGAPPVISAPQSGETALAFATIDDPGTLHGSASGINNAGVIARLSSDRREP